MNCVQYRLNIGPGHGKKKIIIKMDVKYVWFPHFQVKRRRRSFGLTCEFFRHNLYNIYNIHIIFYCHYKSRTI